MINNMFIPGKSSIERAPQIFSTVSPYNGNIFNCYSVSIDTFLREINCSSFTFINTLFDTQVYENVNVIFHIFCISSMTYSFNLKWIYLQKCCIIFWARIFFLFNYIENKQRFLLQSIILILLAQFL